MFRPVSVTDDPVPPQVSCLYLTELVYRQQNPNHPCVWTLEEAKMCFPHCNTLSTLAGYLTYRASFRSTNLTHFLASFGNICVWKLESFLWSHFFESSLEEWLGFIHVLVSISFPCSDICLSVWKISYFIWLHNVNPNLVLIWTFYE